MPPIRPIVRAAALVCACGSSLPTLAQQQSQAAEAAPQTQSASPATLERVEVTGSRIKRLDAETSSAIQVITREDIERSGAVTASDVLRNVPAGNVGGYSTEGPTTSAFGSAGISLRGLGVGSTLVLINGRRVAPFGFGTASFVDTNSIPVEAIERIEVLLDGASAIYGADAIGGVVNILLRKNYQGLAVKGSFGQTTYSDGRTRSAGLNYGVGALEKDGYNLLVNYSHRGSDPVLANQRQRTADGDFREFGLSDRRSTYYRNVYRLSSTSGYYMASNSFIAPLTGTDTPCTPAVSPTAGLNGRCLNDNTGAVTVQSDYQSDALYMAGTLKLPAGFELFGDASLTRTNYKSNSFSYGTDSYGAYTSDLRDVNGSFGNAKGGNVSYLILPVGHPQNPITTGAVGVRYLFNDVKRATESTSNNRRFTLGVRGELAGWDVESALMYSTSGTNTVFRGFVRDSVLTTEVMDANGMIKPSFILGNAAANDPALMARLYPTLNNEARTSTASFDVRGSRDLMALPGGQLAVSLGAEARRETFEAVPDELFSSGAITLFNQQGSTGKRSVTSVYGELVAPVLKSVELSLAARRDGSNDFGSSSTPKAGIKWQVLPQLVMRASYAEGFRAPTLPEQYKGTTTYYIKVQDPKLCPVFDADNNNCARYVTAIYGQAGDLKAEQSKSRSFGLVYQPTPNVSLAIDTYDIKRRNEVSSPSTKNLLDNEALYPEKVVRNAITGQIDQISLTSTNLAETHVQGVDVEGRVAFSIPEVAGRFNAFATYNKLSKYETAATPTAATTDYAGYYTLPKERMRYGFSWAGADWYGSVTWNYTGPYQQIYGPENTCAYAKGAHPEYCRISSWRTADGYIGYRGFKNLDLGLSIRNMADREAPFDADMTGYLLGYNASYHNQLGRTYLLNAKYTFW